VDNGPGKMFPLISKSYHNFIYCFDQVQVSYAENISEITLFIDAGFPIWVAQGFKSTAEQGVLLARGGQRS